MQFCHNISNFVKQQIFLIRMIINSKMIRENKGKNWELTMGYVVKILLSKYY